MPRGQQVLLDADMLELIDRSACLVELIVLESCAPPVLVLSPQQARPAPRPVAAREFPLREALWKVFCSPGLLIPSCSCRFTATLAPDWEVLDDLDLAVLSCGRRHVLPDGPFVLCVLAAQL